VQADLEQSFDATTPHKVHLRVTQDIVDLSSLKVTGQIQYPDQSSQFVVLEDWQAPVSIELRQFPEGGQYQVLLKAEGQTPSGRSFSSELPAVEFETEALPGFGTQEVPEVAQPDDAGDNEENSSDTMAEQPPIQDDAKAPEVTEQQPKLPEPQAEPQNHEPQPEPINWTLWISIGFAANLMLILVGWLVWRMIKKRSYASAEALAQELLEDEDSAETKDE
jgi:uncharacterized protein (TIGR03503 family)